MKKIYLITILLTSCSPNPVKILEKHLQENKSYDYRVWELKDLNIDSKKQISSSCKEYKFTYTLFLKEDCHPKKVISNELFNYFADDEQYYKWNRCWGDSLLKEKISLWREKISEQKNTKVCTRKENIVFGGPCIEWKIVDDQFIEAEVKRQEKHFKNQVKKEYLRKGNVIQVKDTLRICD